MAIKVHLTEQEPTRKAKAFRRFAKKHGMNRRGMSLQDFFYDQASMALGICNHSSWMLMDPNDKRWDEIF